MQKIDYLRISVTDRCNLRCIYCMPEKGVTPYPQGAILTFEEINRVVAAAIKCGVNKVRITGGEPLVRKDITDLIKLLSQNPGIRDLSITTNGIGLERYALPLKSTGIKRVNVSLDTLNESKFKRITRTGELKDVFRGLERAIEAGLSPIKINVVVMKGINENEICSFVKLAENKPFIVRFIEFMNTGCYGSAAEKFIPMSEVRKIIDKRYRLLPVSNIEGAGPATYYRLNSSGIIGFISTVTSPCCEGCTRLRLSSDGKLRSCLYDRYGIDLRAILRGNGDAGAMTQKIKLAISNKPGFFDCRSSSNFALSMSQVGG